MNNHYFDDNRNLAHKKTELLFQFQNIHFKFNSDNGVFSKKGIDYGTKFLLEMLCKHESDLQEDLLDVGCGYGTIGIILKKLYPSKKISMIDVNPRALLLANENAIKNETDVEIKESDCFKELKDAKFHDIISNPPIRAGKKVIYRIFEEAYQHLYENGHLWIVIRKSHGGESAKRFIESIFGNCTILGKDKGYFVLQAKK